MRRFLALGFAGITACTAAEAPVATATVEDSAGVRVVTHESLVPTGNLQIVPEPQTWIRGDEQVTLFEDIGVVAVLSDGTVVVGDRGSRQLHAFTLDGDYLWSAGREGDGPGEFRVINTLLVTSGDTILVLDGRLSRLTLFSQTGQLERVQTLDRVAGAPVAVFSSGELLYQRQTASGDAVDGLRSYQGYWTLGDVSGGAQRPLLTAPGRDTYVMTGEGVMMSVTLRRPHVAARGDGFFFALSDRPQVDHYDLTGRLVSSIRFSTVTEPLTEEDGRLLRESLIAPFPEEMRNPVRGAARELPVPERWPPVADLLTDTEGRVWVQAYEREWAPELRWHVFASDGRYIDEVIGPDGLDPLLIWNGLLVGIWKD